MKFSNAKKIRFAPLLKNGNHAGHVGPVISMSRSKDDFYIALRKSPLQTKISLHGSGISRWAENSNEPRPAIFKGTLDDTSKNRWHTVFRAIYIPFSESFFAINIPNESYKIDGLSLPRSNLNNIIYSFGYLNKYHTHLFEVDQNINHHFHNFSLDRIKNCIASLTGSYYSNLSIFQSSDIFCRGEGSIIHSFRWDTRPNGPFTLGCQYIGNLNTHTFFFIHSIPHETSIDIVKKHWSVNLLKLEGAWQ